MKKFLCLGLAVSFVLTSAFAANAATQGSETKNGGVVTRTPSKLTLKDCNRILTYVIPEMQKQGKALAPQHTKPGKIVNAKRINNTTIAIRFQWGEPGVKGTQIEDYKVTTASYKADNSNPAAPEYFYNNDPVYSYDQELAKYGTNGVNQGKTAFYFGLFDDSTHQICGFGQAQRIKRWSDTLDFGEGFYDQQNDVNFLENHKGL